jgi:VWFA-related protein
VLPRGTRFTSEPAVLRDALASHLTVRGRTALHDALSAALAELGHGTRERKVLIVVGDGGDNASRTTFEQALAAAQASNVVIYTVALVDRLDYDSNPKRLRRLASATGGLAFEPPTGARVEEAFQQISRDIRSSYTLAYAPMDPTRDGRLHRIEVRVYTADGSRHLARTRSGYLALPRGDQGTGQ